MRVRDELPDFSVLHGPALGTPDSLMFWNVHEWELSS
jgi:hypothetical protein